MIIYDLRCENEHSFEGWFRSPEDFESQQTRHLVTCPQCDNHRIRRVPSAVAIASHGEAGKPVRASSSDSSSAGMPALMPAGSEAKALYRQLFTAIMAQSEDVGSRFAEEARKIHYREAPERAIRGQTTDEERSALREEGIDILNLPAPSDDDLN